MKLPSSSVDPLTGLPILSLAYPVIESELNLKNEVGFLYFDIVQFRRLEEKYGHHQCRDLLRLLGITLQQQKGKLYRDEDLVVVGGKGLDFFILFLFSPPRRKENFANHDLKLISTRIKQKLQHVIDEHSDELGISEDVDFHTGYTVIKKDPYMEVERLIYEAKKEAGFKSQLEEIMVQFISNVSHELRTPLTSIKGYAETLMEGAMNDPDLCKRWLNIIYCEAQRLERLINDLLDLSMLEAEQVELIFKPLDITEVVEEVVNLLQYEADKENIKIITRFQENLPLLIGDKDRIKQVLLNLVHNALKYSKRKSQVIVAGETYKHYVKISVSDQGTGIPPSQLEKVFERFYRAEKNRSGRAGGRGLGLAIARDIVEIHGGSIWAESVLDQGSTFHFLLPIENNITYNSEII